VIPADDKTVDPKPNPVFPPTTDEPTTEPSTKPTDKTTTTTTEKPDTTTVKPTDPTTATTVKPTTAPPAPPAFPNNVGKWSVTNTISNLTCIILSGALQLSVLDPTDNKTTTSINVPTDAAAKGKCGPLIQTITLTWKVGEDENANNLTLQFRLNQTATGAGAVGQITPNNYALEEVMGFVHYMVNKTEEEKSFTIEELFAFQTKRNSSYKCEALEGLKQKKGGDGVELKFEHLRMEAFRTATDSKFSTAIECSLDGYVADIVPIAVGASLAGLVAIVLVAYLIGRRRSRARGYQSV